MRKQTYKTQIVLILTVTVIGLLLPLVAQAGALGAPREGTPQTGQSISRRADGSSSGPSRRYRARTPVPLEDGDGEEPIPRLGSGGSPITVNIETSRTSGVAPLAVFFDVVGDIESPNLTWDEIESHEFIWDFGEGTEADTSSGGRYFSGYLAAHVYETPDTYTVTLTVKQDGQVVATDTEVITVSSFTGRTLCVSPSSDFADCPSSSSSDHFTDFTTAWNQITTDSRLLLHRGESWTLTQSYSSSVPGPVIIGAYGSGEKPHITKNIAGNLFNIAHRDWRFKEIYITMAAPANRQINFLTNEGLVLDVEIDNTPSGTADDAAIAHSDDKSLLFIVNTYIHNINGHKGVMLSRSERDVIINSIIQTFGTHAIRSHGNKFLITNNEISRWGSNGHAMKIAGRRSSSPEGGSFYGFISNNIIKKIEGSSGNAIAIQPQNSATEAYISKVIIEKNTFIVENLAGFNLDMSIIDPDIVIRNNVGIRTNKFVSVGSYEIGPYAENIKVYANSIYSDNNNFKGLIFGGGIQNIEFKNNVAYATSANSMLVSLTGPPGELDASNNIGFFPNHQIECVDASGGNTCTDPLFMDPDGLDDILGTLDDDLRLQPNSPAIDSGAPLIPLFEDFDNNPRPQDGPDPDTIPQWDIGAYEYALLTLPGDFDQDGDVDLDDYAVFEAAYAGSGRPPANDDYRPDLDGDGDVDLDDFSIFAANYTG